MDGGSTEQAFAYYESDVHRRIAMVVYHPIMSCYFPRVTTRYTKMESQLIDTVEGIRAFLDRLDDTTSRVYVDLEGANLSRKGTLSLMTILVEAHKKVYLVDVTTLQNAAFDTVGPAEQSRSLRGVLESSEFRAGFARC